MEAKHTPGPWVARQEFANRWRIEANPNGPGYVPISVGLACTTVLEVGCSNADTEANARLIAAAPELADELREARTTLSILRTQIMVEINRGVDRWEGVPEKLKERLDAIDAAIAKVEGRADA